MRDAADSELHVPEHFSKVGVLLQICLQMHHSESCLSSEASEQSP